MEQILICPNCGTKNRINGNSDSSKAVCADCWTKLDLPKRTVKPPPPPEESYTPPAQTTDDSSESGGSGCLWLVVIGLLIWWGLSQNSKVTPSTNTQTTYSKPAPKPKPSYPVVTMNNGEEQHYTTAERIAPFTIETSYGANYLVKLVSASTDKTVMTIFIKGGRTVSTTVPLGTYTVKYASGKEWYGYNHLFGKETNYSKADTTFTFENTGSQISGYTITLYNVTNGNLSTSRLSPSQF